MKAKKLITVVAVFVMLVVFALPFTQTAAALSEEKGSITIRLIDSDTKQPLVNASVRLYFVAKANIDSKGISYELIKPYDKANIDIGNLRDYALPVHLAYFAESHSLSYTEKITDEKGVIVFDNLTAGLYLAVPVQSATGSYTISPFLINVPDYDSESQKWNYNIKATPKILDGAVGSDGDKTYISVVKKWDTDKAHPESITVVLLRDFQEYLKVELNADNNWHYRFDNLPKNHTWNVVEMLVPDGYTVYYDTSSNTVTIINKSDESQEEGTTQEGVSSEDSTQGEETTGPSEGGTEEDKLAQTGQLNWPVPVCAISGLLIFSIGWAVLNFGKKESE